MVGNGIKEESKPFKIWELFFFNLIKSKVTDDIKLLYQAVHLEISVWILGEGNSIESQT